MNIRQIETFVRIVELGSFQAAAAHLCASPSTVSARVKELERYIGDELFDRSFHRAHLTAKGREFYGPARQLVDFTGSLSSQIRSPKAVSGNLRIGVVGLVANTWLPKLYAAIRAEYPNVTLAMVVDLTRALMDQLSEGKLDIAIVAGRTEDHRLCCELLGHDEFVWMSAQTEAFRAGPPAQPLTPHEIAQHPVLALSEDSHHFPIVRQWFREAGIEMKVAASCNNISVLASLTRQGLGVSLLPLHAYREELTAGQLVALPTTPSLRKVPFSVVYPRDRLPMLAREVTDMAKIASDLPDAGANLSRCKTDVRTPGATGEPGVAYVRTPDSR